MQKDKATPDRKVRVHFQSESWDLLLSGTVELVLELWNLADPEPGHAPICLVDLFVKGSVVGTIRGKEVRFSDDSQLFWINRQPLPHGPERMKVAPDWWKSPPAPGSSDEFDRLLIALTDFHEAFGRTDAVMDEVFTRVKESRNPSERAVGVLFLAAMDTLPLVLQSLESPHASVRHNAAFVLRHWMSRSHDHEAEMLRLIQDKSGFLYSKENAELFIRLLRGYTSEQTAKVEVRDLLLDNLQHKNAAIRELAIRSLELSRPDLAQNIHYSAVDDVDKRKQAASEWTKRLGESNPKN